MGAVTIFYFPLYFKELTQEPCKVSIDPGFFKSQKVTIWKTYIHFLILRAGVEHGKILT